MSDSDSDSDLGAFSFLSTKIEVVEVEEEEEVENNDASEWIYTSSASSVIPMLEELLLLRDVKSMESLGSNLGSSATKAEMDLFEMCKLLLTGRHLEVLREFSVQDLSVVESLNLCMMDGDCVAQIRGRLFYYICSGEDEVDRECRSFQCLVLAVTYLELYCRENYTGPQLDPHEVELLYKGGKDAKEDDYDAFIERVQAKATLQP